MKNKELDDKIRNTLNRFEPELPESLWMRIDGQLSAEQSFNEKISQKLNTINTAPSPKVWKHIEAKITKQSNPIALPRFTYPSIAAAIALLLAGAWIITHQGLQHGTAPQELAQIELGNQAIPSSTPPETVAPTSPSKTATAQISAFSTRSAAAPTHTPTTRITLAANSVVHTNNSANAAASTEMPHPLLSPQNKHTHTPDSTTEPTPETNNLTASRQAATQQFLLDGTSQATHTLHPTASRTKRRSSNLAIALAGYTNSSASSYIKPGIPASLNASPNNIRSIQLLTAGTTEIVKPTNIQHHLPITASLNLQNRFTKFFALELGLSYTLLTSELNKTGAIKQHEIQSLHYIGIPVSTIFTIWENKWLQVYAKIGGAIEKNIFGTYDITLASNTNTNKYREIITDNQLQFSTHANIGIGYNLTKNWQLSIEPGLVYYFDNHSQLLTIRKEKPLDFSLSAAVKYVF